jgi:uncharacterized protein with HEPN domain
MREFLDYVEDIIGAMNDVIAFAEGIEFEDFKNNKMKIYASLRALEIIGEATKNVPDEIKECYPQIPWKDMAGMRDKLAHEYFGVVLEVVWDTIKKEIPETKPLLEKMAKDFEG